MIADDELRDVFAQLVGGLRPASHLHDDRSQKYPRTPKPPSIARNVPGAK